jgi:hypothetical protein
MGWQMFRKTNFPPYPVKKTNVGKVSAEILMKDGTVYRAHEIGFAIDSMVKMADTSLFFDRRERKGFLMVKRGMWVPVSDVCSINITLEDHLV